MIRSAVFEVNDIKNGSSLKGIRLKHEFSQNSGQFEDRDFIWLAIVGVLLIVIISIGVARSKKQRVYNEGATSLYQNKVLWIQNWLSRNGDRSTVESCIENEEVNSSLLSKPPAYAV